MPRLRTRETVDVDIEFEVYCNSCGKGLCNYTKTDDHKQAIYVDACPDCINERDIIIRDLEKQIEDLEEENEDLKDEIRSLECTIKEK